MDFEDKVCPEPKQAMTDEKLLELWRSLPSDYKQFDELVLQFGRLVMSTITPCVKTDIDAQAKLDEITVCAAMVESKQRNDLKAK